MATKDELIRAYTDTGSGRQAVQDPVAQAYRQAAPAMTRQAAPMNGGTAQKAAPVGQLAQANGQAAPIGNYQAMGAANPGTRIGIPENGNTGREAPAAPDPTRAIAPGQEYMEVRNPAYSGTPGPYSAENQTAPATEIPATTPVTYVDEAGQAQQGVADTQDIPGYPDAMRNYYQQMLDEQTGANEAAAAAAAERARAATQAQIDALNAGYQGTNRELYRDYMERQRTLPQQLAAQGYTGGLTESSRLRMGNAYQEALAGNERARLSEESGANAALAQQLFESRMATDQANQQARQQYLQYMAGLEEQQYQEQQARADQLAASGDFSGYLGLGYSQDEVDYLTRLWLKQNPKLLNTWIDAHPEEAARLGIKKKKKKGSRGGSQPKVDPTTGEYIYFADGYSDQDIANAINNGRNNMRDSPLARANDVVRGS